MRKVIVVVLQEIPEFKTIYGAQNYFAASKASFWNFYHDYKPFTDPSDWFPPFQGETNSFLTCSGFIGIFLAQALLFGGRYYVTFDRVAYTFQGNCSYLLTSDFLDHNFTVAVSYDNRLKRIRQLIVLVNDTTVEIDVLNNVSYLIELK